MYTNRTRMVGLSGIDTDALVKQLMQAESIKYNNLKKQNTIIKWQQEKYRDVASALQSFSDSFLSITSSMSMRMNATFGGYTATAKIAGADTSKVSVKTTGNSKEGSYKFTVSQLARKSSVTSASKSDFGGKIISDGTFDLEGLEAGDTIKFSLDGSTKTIKITDDFLTSKEDFAKELEEALHSAYGKTYRNVEDEEGNVIGVKGFFDVSFDSIDRLTIATTEKGHDLKVYEGTRKSPTSATGGQQNNDFKLENGGTYSFEVNGLTVSVELDNGSSLSQIAKKVNEALGKDDDLKKLGLKASVKDNSIVFSSSNPSEVLRIEAAETGNLLAEIGFDEDVIELKNTSVLSHLGLKNNDGTFETTKKKLSDLFDLSSLGAYDPATGEGYDSATGEITFKIKDVEIKVKEDDTLQSLINKINGSKAGVTVSYDTITEKFTMESKSEGEINGFTQNSISGDLKKLFGFNGAEFVNAQDAVFTINGVETSRTSNSFTIGGLNVTLNEETRDEEEITVNVQKDTSKALDVIKEFVSAYNALISKINGEVETKRAKNGKYSYYEPLTDDEKSAMSESEIKLWEDKAKEGLLYRDSILSGITRDMRNAMYQKVEISDGKYLSLYEIGITTTSNYWEGGKLVIDEEKLSKALEEHGEDVAKLFTASNSGSKGYTDVKQGIGERINNIVENAIGSKGSITKKAGVESRAMSLTTNDLYKLLQKQEDKISDMLNWLIEKEDYYYSMFSKMEAAVMQSNSQMNYLTAQLGM